MFANKENPILLASDSEIEDYYLYFSTDSQINTKYVILIPRRGISIYLVETGLDVE